MSNAAPVGVSPKEQQSNSYATSNSQTTNTTNNTRDIGFTGQAGVDFASVIGNTTFQGLDRLVGAAESISQGGYDLTQHATDRNLETLDTTSFRVNETLANTINLVRDASQRALNVSSGQATPLADIPAASASILPTQLGLNPRTLVIGGVIVGIIVLVFLLKKGKK